MSRLESVKMSVEEVGVASRRTKLPPGNDAGSNELRYDFTDCLDGCDEGMMESWLSSIGDRLMSEILISEKAS